MPVKLLRTSVHCEADWHVHYQNWTGAKSKAIEKPFATMTQAFVTFACLGKKFGRFSPLRTKQEIFIANAGLDAKVHVPILVSLAYDQLVRRSVDPDEALTRVSTSSGFIPEVEGLAQGGAEYFREVTSGEPNLTEALVDLLLGEEALGLPSS